MYAALVTDESSVGMLEPVRTLVCKQFIWHFSYDYMFAAICGLVLFPQLMAFS